MALTDLEKVQARRLMWYPAYGDGQPQYGGRFTRHYENLEFRFKHLTAEEETEFRAMVVQALAFEASLSATVTDMDTAKASVWTRNPQHLREVRSIYTEWRKKLCEFMDVPYGPAKTKAFGNPN